MTNEECTGDCENQCSGRQTCPLLCEETSLADEMELDDYINYLNSKSHSDDY